MRDFDREMADMQVAWRERNASTSREGRQNGVARPWILPPELWEEGLWPGIRSGSASSVQDYLQTHEASRHTGSHNLKSSWVSGANLYFPFGQSPSGLQMLSGFLASCVDDRVETVDSVELEYAESGALSPERLLGETGGSRGSGQTSPDLAFIVNGRKGLLLVENKLTEHSFYPCSARTTTGSDARPANPDRRRCDDVMAVIEDVSCCHQQLWGRKYWDLLRSAANPEQLARLSRCPAASAGYQLLRQQALAEGIAQSGRYDFVVSGVALDERNERLAGSMRSTGISDVRDWGSLFDGAARFAVFTHQDWTRWVRAHDTEGEWSDWADWVEQRYKL